MSQAIFLYPTTPANVPDSITQPSASFKKGVSGVMGSIILFFVVYLLLLMFSIALVVACVYGGIMIISNVVNVLTIILALGLFGVGIMVFVFLVKFMFAVSRYDRSGMVEVTEADQPVLFSFIRQLTIDTQTKFPRRIYLSADVNASVFYDSNFWSMFFPVRKNLQIGLGLVNVINITEFKAVMAHEFGHFSQRSMKLGSFVYNVNHVIHNMLFENRS
jgi:Zn-dependent protease with chaperone function